MKRPFKTMTMLLYDDGELVKVKPTALACSGQKRTASTRHTCPVSAARTTSLRTSLMQRATPDHAGPLDSGEEASVQERV